MSNRQDSIKASNEFHEFIESLQKAGWTDNHDSQWTGIIPLFLEYRAAQKYRIEWAKCDEKLKMVAAAIGDTNRDGTYVQAKIIAACIGEYAQPKS